MYSTKVKKEEKVCFFSFEYFFFIIFFICLTHVHTFIEIIKNTKEVMNIQKYVQK